MTAYEDGAPERREQRASAQLTARYAAHHKAHTTRQETAKAALLEDPCKSNLEIAASTGVHAAIVGKVRRLLVRDREIHKFDRNRRLDPVETGHARDCWCGWFETCDPEHDRLPKLARPWALITWHGPARAGKVAYYATQAEAEAEAPADQPVTIINVDTTPKPREDLDALIRRPRRHDNEGTAKW